MNWIKRQLKRFWRWLIVVVVGGVAVANIIGIPPIDKPIIVPSIDEPTYFAEIDASGNVLRVLVISQEMVNTGLWGDPKNWIETTIDGSLKKNYAGKGYKYDKNLDAFISSQPYTSWILDKQTAKWEAPQKKPKDGKRYEWNESNQSWKVQ